MFKTPFEPIFSRVDRALTLLERIAAALEKIAKKEPVSHTTIHQTLPRDPKKETPTWPPYPGIQPHYPFPNTPFPTFPGINPNVPGLGPYWTSLGSDLYANTVTTKTTRLGSDPVKPQEPSASTGATLYGLPVITDSDVAPGTVRVEQPVEPPASGEARTYNSTFKKERQSSLDELTSATYVTRLLENYLNGTKKV